MHRHVFTIILKLRWKILYTSRKKERLMKSTKNYIGHFLVFLSIFSFTYSYIFFAPSFLLSRKFQRKYSSSISPVFFLPHTFAQLQRSRQVIETHAAWTTLGNAFLFVYTWQRPAKLASMKTFAWSNININN